MSNPSTTPSFDKSLVDLLEEYIRIQPDAHALTAVRCGKGDIGLSYRALWRDAHQFADGLRKRGVCPGEHVGVMLNNTAGYEACISMLATHRLGGVFVPINARFSPRELIYVIRKARCSVLVAQADLSAIVEMAWSELAAVKLSVLVTDASGPGSWGEIFENGDPEAGGWPVVELQQTAEILFTSGTTAHPKGAVMTHSRCVASAHDFAFEIDLRPDDVCHSFFPIFTTAAIHCVVLAAWWTGCAAVLDPALAVTEVVARMAKERTTVYVGSPTFYAFLLEADQDFRKELKTVRLFSYGGSAMPVERIRRLSEAFPTVELRQTYGQTESGGPATFLAGEFAFHKIGAIGRPSPSTEICIVNADRVPLCAHQVGEIALRSPCMMREYFDEPELTSQTIREGWLLTGDMGYFDADGFFYHVDRKKDMIIRGGHNIGSLEVEEVLLGHPMVHEAAVVGVPHAKLGEDIVAFLVLRGDGPVSSEAIRNHCLSRLADYKIPRVIHTIEKMPRGPMGKILKSELRQMVRGLPSSGS